MPDFLDLPARDGKPRSRGITHVLDKGTPMPVLEARLAETGSLIDILKIGWGIGYLDPMIKQRVALCGAAGVLVSLGGTLLEVSEAQGKVDELRQWAIDTGFDAIEVSNGLQAMSLHRKRELIRSLAEDFVVLAETGAKAGSVPVVAEQWLSEMDGDLKAGATWVIAEGRESGTAGLYELDGTVRANVVDTLAAEFADRVIYEAPAKAQQAWFVHRFGVEANLGNVPAEEVLAVETLRVGLRADTAELGGV